MKSFDRERVFNCCLMLGGAAAVLRELDATGPCADPRVETLRREISALCASASALAEVLAQEKPRPLFLVPAAD